MFAEGGRRVGDLAVDDEVDQVLGLVLLDRSGEETELASGLLATLPEATFVERESQLSILEDEVVTRAVITSAEHLASASYVRILRSREDECDVAGGRICYAPRLLHAWLATRRADPRI